MPNSKKKKNMPSSHVGNATLVTQLFYRSGHVNKTKKNHIVPEYFKGLIDHKNKKIPIIEEKIIPRQSNKTIENSLLSIFLLKKRGT